MASGSFLPGVVLLRVAFVILVICVVAVSAEGEVLYRCRRHGGSRLGDREARFVSIIGLMIRSSVDEDFGFGSPDRDGKGGVQFPEGVGVD